LNSFFIGASSTVFHLRTRYYVYQYYEGNYYYRKFWTADDGKTVDICVVDSTIQYTTGRRASAVVLMYPTP